MKSSFKYIDIHTHVNLSAFDEDRDEVLERTREEGVAHINVGTMHDTSLRAVELAERYKDGVYATVGIHPVHSTKSFHDKKELGEEGKEFTSRGEQFDISFYKELASHDKVVAIGECGLDYYRIDKDTKEKQDESFIAHIDLANELEKPLMLHIRPSEGKMDAYEDALGMLKQYAKVRGNVHFFAGTPEIAKGFWDMGFSTSFTGVITFADQYDEVVKAAPLEMLHGETDAPYVAPKPYRGQRNEPLYVVEVYKRIAELREEDEKKVREQFMENARELFNLQI